MHIGILTGGGDCPGLNAVIRAVTLSLIGEAGARVTGIRRGFLGLIAQDVLPLDAAAVSGILAEGGTILGTHNRCDPFHYFGANGADVSPQVLAYAQTLGLDGLVVIGGDGTMAIAHAFQRAGLPVVGVPKTIDNDLYSTDRSFGFDSAVTVVAEALDRLRSTARSHGRVMVVETMGRYAGWIALEGGLAGGADVLLLPELPYSVEAVVARCRARERQDGYTLVCVAEGAHPVGGDLAVARTVAGSPEPLRLGGIAAQLAHMLEPQLDSEVRTTLLGHLQRGGTPTAFDRVLATRFGYAAAQLVRQRAWGHMVGLQGTRIVPVPLADELVSVARGLGVALGEA